jgi:hypothetical protein
MSGLAWVVVIPGSTRNLRPIELVGTSVRFGPGKWVIHIVQRPAYGIGKQLVSQTNMHIVMGIPESADHGATIDGWRS